MTESQQKYCLDANVLIQAWQKYYSPRFCPDYWSLLNDFGESDKIFLPQNVFEEIIKTEDDLANWLKDSRIPVKEIDGEVANYLRDIYTANPLHKYLVDNTRQRSLADPGYCTCPKRKSLCRD